MSNWGRVGVFDLETTGVDVETSRIVSACIAVLDEAGTVLARWDWLADPAITIPDGAAAVHGITTERARAEGRPAETVVAEITQTLRTLIGLHLPIVVYNAPYDLTLLDRECRRHGLSTLPAGFSVIDPLVLDKAVDRYRKGKRTLQVTAEHYGVSLDDAHDAGSDAIAAGSVALALARAYPEQLAVPASELHDRQVLWYADQAASFERYRRSSQGDPSFVAETIWPLRPPVRPAAFLDTQPIPIPTPRQSDSVAYFDFGVALPSAGEDVASAPLSKRADHPVETPPPLLEEREMQFTTDEADTAMKEAPIAAQPQEPLGGTAQETGVTSRPTVLRVAAGIVTDGSGRTLLVRKTGTTIFMQAGGKIERGESAFDALARELLEEIGLEVDPDTTEYLGSHRAIAANEPNTVVRAEVFAVSTQQVLRARSEIAELLWIDDVESIQVELAPLTRETILPLWTGRRSSLF
jgi:DNA polymerase III epsilon subunit-like protein/8-oxo-dGTP pyrophosphatase MutT (NUDIX family)